MSQADEKWFSFGKNWRQYVRNSLTQEKLDQAKQSLLDYLPREEYAGKAFIDVGCGSGIFSLSVLNLGAKKVISFDIDPSSVESTKIVKERFASALPANVDWEIMQASILDDQTVEKFRSTGDIVYSWGVLHHTGSMNQAIKNTTELVKPGGYFIIAIYNRTPASANWVKIKRFYNNTNSFVRWFMNWSLYLVLIFRRFLAVIKNTILSRPREPIFSRERGMSIYYDVVDWLGGYPYEFATWEELRDMIEPMGFSLVSVPSKLPIGNPRKFLRSISFYATGNNIFVFKKNA